MGYRLGRPRRAAAQAQDLVAPATRAALQRAGAVRRRRIDPLAPLVALRPVGGMAVLARRRGPARFRSGPLSGWRLNRATTPTSRGNTMQLDLTGKHALGWGASQGIGRATAIELAGLGARVTALARSADKLDALVADLPGGSSRGHDRLVVDMSDGDALRARV